MYKRQILFIESPESIDEMKMIGSHFDIPVLANMVDRGKTPVLSKLELQNLGYQIAIFPVTALLASVAAMSTVYSQLSNNGSSTDIQDILYDFTALSKLMGFEDIWNFEKKYVEIE